MYKSKLWTAIALIVAHFTTSLIYAAFVGGNWFYIHMSQAAIYIAISLMSIEVKFRVAALSVVFMYILIAINWLFLERDIELKIQEIFYDNFYMLVNCLNLITILLFGWDHAIRLFNRIFDGWNVRNKSRLRDRIFSNSCVSSGDISISDTHNKSKGQG